MGDLPNARSKHLLWLPLLWILRGREDVTHLAHNAAPVDSWNIQNKTLFQFHLHHLQVSLMLLFTVSI